MHISRRSSRQRFREYRSRLHSEREAANGSHAGKTTADQASTQSVEAKGTDRGSNSAHDTPKEIASDRRSEFSTENLPQRSHRSFTVLFGALWGLIRDYRAVVVFSLVTVTVSTLLSLIPLYGTKIVFDYVLTDRQAPRWLDRLWPGDGLPHGRDLLLSVTGAMLGLSLISLAIGMLGRWQLTLATQRVQSDVQRRVFEHALRLPLHRVHEMKSGGMASLLSEDATSAGQLLFAMLYNPWRAVIQLMGGLAILAWTDWRLLTCSFVVLPTVWMTHRTWIGRIRPMYRHIRASRQRMTAHATEVFAGMRIVRGFNRQRSEASRFTGNTHLRARQELHAWRWSRGIDIAWSILIPAATAGILAYGGVRILDDAAAVQAGTLATEQALTLGDLVMFLTYLGWLLDPIASLATSATMFQNGLAGLDRTLDLLQEAHELPDRPEAKDVPSQQVAGRITLRDVWFTYPTSTEPVIRGIDLDVPAGQTVALVGPSGSGKTTLCNLIARFFDPTTGRVELDAVDLRDIRLHSYRNLLGIVEQDVFLFDGSVAQNIGYVQRHVDMKQIVRAAKLANAHEFISRLDDGYDTIIGERGVRLSGGQRQRLAIARAILADPRILILDEATSSLDTDSERLIQASLRGLMANRTCFVIAHRLSTISGANQIVVIDGGRVVEQGGHDELMARSGRYRHMVEMQTQPIVESVDDEPATANEAIIS